jgi:hypothetical protein
MVVMKYQKSTVYMIKSLVTNDVFVSSTTQRVSQRIKTLKRNHREYKAGKRKFTTVYQIMDAGDYTYETLQSVGCESKVTLRETEQEWIRRLVADDTLHVLEQQNEPRRHPCADDINLLRAPCCEFIDIVNKVLALDDTNKTIDCLKELCLDIGMRDTDILMSQDIVAFMHDVYGGKHNFKYRLAKNIRTPLKKLAVIEKKYNELPKRG